jgi:hypothetical protein
MIFVWSCSGTTTKIVLSTSSSSPRIRNPTNNCRKNSMSSTSQHHRPPKSTSQSNCTISWERKRKFRRPRSKRSRETVSTLWWRWISQPRRYLRIRKYLKSRRKAGRLRWRGIAGRGISLVGDSLKRRKRRPRISQFPKIQRESRLQLTKKKSFYLISVCSPG